MAYYAIIMLCSISMPYYVITIFYCYDNGISWYHYALLHYHNALYCALQYPTVLLWCFIVPSQWILVQQQLCV